MKYTLRAGLAVALLLGVYLLALAIVAGLAGGLYEIVAHGVSGAGVVKLFLLAVVIAAAIGRGLWAGLRLPDGEPEGVELSEQAQPRLWAEVRGLAGRLGTRPPEEIRLVPEVNAAVSESSRWMGLVPGTRRMYVGVPLLTGLSEQQMRSVLAHELGHYSGRHTALARITYRGQESLVRVIGHVGPRTVVGRVFTLYARLYFAVAGAVNRRQELEADTFSAQVAGKGTAIRALEELEPISAAWSLFLENYVRACCGEAHRPREVFAGFHELWSTPERQRQLDEIRHDPPVVQRSVYDTHPSTAERVARLSALDAPDTPDASGPAIGLLDDAPATLLRLEEWMFDGSDLEPVAWDEALAVALSASTRRNAALLVSAVEQGGDSRTDLDGILLALRNGWTRELVAPLMPAGATDEEHQQAAGQLVGDLVAAALLDTGVGSYRLDWSRAASLADASGEPLDPWRLTHDAALSPAAVPALETWCGAHGIPGTFRIEPAGLVPAHPEPRSGRPGS